MILEIRFEDNKYYLNKYYVLKNENTSKVLCKLLHRFYISICICFEYNKDNLEKKCLNVLFYCFLLSFIRLFDLLTLFYNLILTLRRDRESA